MSREKKPLAIVCLSGGLDSATLAYTLARYCELLCLGFNYGQRHVRELDAAKIIATMLKVDFIRVPMSFVGLLLTGSSLTDGTVDVPDGHYTHETMKKTVVPNRNAIMLSVAYGVAVARGAEIVATSVHAGDHAIYPDCRPEFVSALTKALQLGNDGMASPLPMIHTPFINKSKADIARLAVDEGVPIEHTWSCYKGGELHCGTCGTCVERREAFKLINHPDPTPYEVPWGITEQLLATAGG